jgi:hypothetical protein
MSWNIPLGLLLSAAVPENIAKGDYSNMRSGIQNNCGKVERCLRRKQICTMTTSLHRSNSSNSMFSDGLVLLTAVPLDGLEGEWDLGRDSGCNLTQREVSKSNERQRRQMWATIKQ